MTMIHVSNEEDERNHEYTELHRIGSLTLRVCVDFYKHDIEYSDAIVAVLSEKREWTELAVYAVNLWYDIAHDTADSEVRLNLFKTITKHLLNVGLEALGVLPPSDAEAPAEDAA